MRKVEMEVWQEIIENPEHGAKRLIAEYRDRLYASALFLCTDPAAAEDLVYRTFERVIERVREHRPDSSFYAWIYTILLNFHRMNARREMRKPLEYVEKLPEIPTDDPTTIERLVMKTDAANLRAAVRALPPDMRETVVLRYFEDLPLAEVAALTEVRVGTVKSRLNRAKRMLYEALTAIERKEDNHDRPK